LEHCRVPPAFFPLPTKIQVFLLAKDNVALPWKTASSFVVVWKLVGWETASSLLSLLFGSYVGWETASSLLSLPGSYVVVVV
jgi:hypothetical protein